MNKKRVVGVLILSFCWVVCSYANQKPLSQKQITVDDIVAKMTTQLGLTDQQALAVKPIVEDYMAQEQQLKLAEKKLLSKVLTGQQLFTWNFLQNEQPRDKEKKKKSSL